MKCNKYNWGQSNEGSVSMLLHNHYLISIVC
ncbi:tetracycline resistance efflux system leader peptide [Lysinibacillus xylanilyticus]